MSDKVKKEKGTAFIHLRDHDRKGKLLVWGGCTIAYIYEVIGDTLNIRYAFAECNSKDRFIKRIGRQIARARLNTDGEYEVLELPGNLEEDVEQYLVYEYYSYKNGIVKEYDVGQFLFPVKPGYKDEIKRDFSK